MSLLLKGNIFIIISIFELLISPLLSQIGCPLNAQMNMNNEQKCLKRIFGRRLGIMSGEEQMAFFVKENTSNK